ncbi:LOW QUALITY PROTEIN: hypothetical protein Cgig2_004792 [Carnegiea gigantea]|uniref:Uncharacterized protein n=1 Tax=Carnegiea gigantea TaxID=171969 RepID=A0A9Q1KUW2_9CARY|nr:LOW QUALITY PROTEIN: hypothetical protein Cgig2_004792 [Carnegiea gigantea]
MEYAAGKYLIVLQLIFELESYIRELKKTGGAIKEFVTQSNFSLQVYKDDSKTSLKSSTRLECMMQDYPKTLAPIARVGVTDIWLAYAPVKNNPEDAAKVPKGNPYHSATSGELAIYRARSLLLRKVVVLITPLPLDLFFTCSGKYGVKKAGVQIGEPIKQVFNGQEVDPSIVWKPKWASTFSDVKRKVGGNCSISQGSTMVVKGRNVSIKGLSLDGALVVDCIDDAEVKVEGSVRNNGWITENVDNKDTSLPEEVRIRGFKINKTEQLEGSFHEPGKYCLKP